MLKGAAGVVELNRCFIGGQIKQTGEIMEDHTIAFSRGETTVWLSVMPRGVYMSVSFIFFPFVW